MSRPGYVGDPLWPILVETVHSIVMFPSHKAFTRDAVFPEHPRVSPQELRSILNISLGEALVIMHELLSEMGTSRAGSVGEDEEKSQ